MAREHQLRGMLILSAFCVGFAGTTAAVLIYMAKDYNGYNLVSVFFNVSAEQRMALEHLSIGKTAVLRMMNVSCALYPCAAALYAISFSEVIPRRMGRALGGAAMAVAVLQAVLMDPQAMIYFYMNGVGPFENIFFFRRFYRALPLCLRVYDNAAVIMASVVMLFSCMVAPRFVRTGEALLTLLLTGVSAIYLYLYYWLPVAPLWLSRVAKYVRFDSLPVGKPTAFNHYAPTLSVLFIVCFCLGSVYQLSRLNSQRRYNSLFRNKITASEAVSRAFCHYLKNELLAQQAELKLLSARLEPPLQKDVSFIIDRNTKIYQRLGSVNESLKQRAIAMESLNMAEFVRAFAREFESRNGIPIALSLPRQDVMIKGNAEHLREVLNCIMKNAVEAWAPPGPPLELSIDLSATRHYAILALSNNGPRIPREMWDRVFDPFFTTKKTGQNWGLGLSICKSIVTLHGGRIWLDERLDGGKRKTTFHILLRTTDER